MSKAIVVRLDEDLARQMERFVPARLRGQSAFIRRAILRAIMDLQEMETRAAYERQPDQDLVGFVPGSLEPEDWENEYREGHGRRRGAKKR